MKKELTARDFYEQNKTAVLTAAGVLIVILAILIYTDLTKARLTLLVPQPGSAIIVDERPEAFTRSPGEAVTLRLSPGTHNVLVSANGTWPWAKDIVLHKNEEVTYPVFTFPREPQYEKVTTQDPEYQEALALFSSPSTSALSVTENIAVRTSGTKVLAVWRGEDTPSRAFCEAYEECQDRITVYEGVEEIENAVFLYGREDLVIFDKGTGVYAIELDKSGNVQNFQPIYSGTDPLIRTSIDQSILYILDEGTLYKATVR